MENLCATQQEKLISEIRAALRDTPSDLEWESAVLPFILWIIGQSDPDPLAVEFAVSDLALRLSERRGFEIAGDKRGVLWRFSFRIMLRYLQLRRYQLDLLEPAVKRYLTKPAARPPRRSV